MTGRVAVATMPGMENTNPIPDDLVDTTKAAQQLKCHTATLYRIMASGRLRYWRRLGRRFVSLREVLALFEPGQPAQKAPPVPQPKGATTAQTEAFQRWLYPPPKQKG